MFTNLFKCYTYLFINYYIGVDPYVTDPSHAMRIGFEFFFYYLASNILQKKKNDSKEPNN